MHRATQSTGILGRRWLTKNYPDTCNPGPMGEKVYSDTHMRYSCEGRSPRTICPAELNAGFVQTIIRRFGSRIKGCGGTMAGERWHEAWTLDAGIDPGPAVLEGPNGRRGLWRGGHSGANWASISRLDQRLRCWPSRLISDAPLTSVGS
jgi:hypothetical protein